jgi:nitrogen fixation NifU-like protein
MYSQKLYSQKLYSQKMYSQKMYSQKMLDHFQNPRSVGDLPSPAVTVEVMNPVCGDILRLSASWSAERIAEARFRARGCTATIAAGSALAEWMAGRTRADLALLTADAVDALLGGLPNESRHAAVLCVDAVRELIRR